MSGEEIRQVVLKNRAYFEKALKRGLYGEWQSRVRSLWFKVGDRLMDTEMWFWFFDHLIGVAIAPLLLTVSPVWLLVTSIIWRRRVRRILSEGGAA